MRRALEEAEAARDTLFADSRLTRDDAGLKAGPADALASSSPGERLWANVRRVVPLSFSPSPASLRLARLLSALQSLESPPVRVQATRAVPSLLRFKRLRIRRGALRVLFVSRDDGFDSALVHHRDVVRHHARAYRDLRERRGMPILRGGAVV